MASFFRRKKPETATTPSTRRYSTEELAAAFPAAAPEVRPPAPPAEPEALAPPPAEAAPVTPAPAAAAAPSEARQPQQQAAATAPAQSPAPAAAEPAASAEPVLAQHVAAPVVPPAHSIETIFPPKPAAPVTPPVAPPASPPPAITPAAAAPAPTVAAPAAPGKPGWRERLRGSGFARSLGGLFSRNPQLDDDLLDEIETALITADVGVSATTQLVEGLRKRMKSREFADARGLLEALRAELVAMLRPVAVPLRIDSRAKPFVVLIVGVNGVGKTTTIGKLAHRFRAEGHTLMLAAGDTFRAAAVAQLQAWGDRNGVPVIAQGQNNSGKGGDAASVAFDALQAAKSRGTQVLIADTAGRLHTQQGLMAELGKIKRVLAKLDAVAPHEVLMVIDGTTGQNALSQLRQFHAAVGVTGLVVTKLDGTAKGGVVFALAQEFGIPIRFAGIGEQPQDLRVFDPEAFVDALLPESLGA